MSPIDPSPFDVTAALPTGTLVLEASAGTGKTWTIAALTARYLAEGVATLDQLMIVTFSRAATHELRGRVRTRLIETESALSLALRNHPLEHLDSVLQLICDPVAEELQRRLDRIRVALAEFDAATIATTHEFCQRMLTGLGVLADSERDLSLIEDLSQLTREAVSDEYLRRYSAAEQNPPFSLEEAIGFAGRAVHSEDAALVPANATGRAAERVDFARAIRTEVERRKRRLRLYTFNDLMIRLDEAIHDDVLGPAALARLRARYSVVLVDEFQDTDPLQWRIVRDSFHGHSTLVLIGDPKQAIYGFRGADVYSYLEAVAATDDVRTLATNFRADSAMVHTLHGLFDRAVLGDPRIVERQVSAHHDVARLQDAAGQPLAPVRLRVLDPSTDPKRVDVLRDRVEADVIDDIGGLLGAGHQLRRTHQTRAGGGRSALTASDIAILVLKNATAERLRFQLAAAGIPAVVVGATSVFSGTAAQHWLTLLAAMEDPRTAAVREVSLTPFVGWSLTELAEADDDELGVIAQRVKGWRRLLNESGVAAAAARINAVMGVPQRLLSQQAGERELADLRHLAELLHGAASRNNFGVHSLRTWLAERIEEARASSDDRSRRLETDEHAVQIMTVHRSKGLEFPVVYLPDQWDRFVFDDKQQVLTLHDERDHRVADVGGFSPGRDHRYQRYLAEEAGNSLRLLYVAATRAQSHLVLWWASSAKNTPPSPLHRLLQRDRAVAAANPTEAIALDYDPELNPTDLGSLRATGVVVEPIAASADGNASADAAIPRADSPAATLAARRFARVIDTTWRRTSYSAITAAAHEHLHSLGSGPGGESGASSARAPANRGSEAEPTATDDETVVSLGPIQHPETRDPRLAELSPMAALPGGTAFGSLVHTIAEYVDPFASGRAGGDLSSAVRAQVAAQMALLPAMQNRGAEPFSVEELTTALVPALKTPLGPLAGERSLADFPAQDRLVELDFEMPLAGGHRGKPAGGHRATQAGSASSAVTVARIADLLEAHLCLDDPLVAYPERLRVPGLGEEVLRGFLTGSIDAVLRCEATDETTGPSGVHPRYLVVDYKTNWLAPTRDTPLTLSYYTHDALARAMMDSHYPLQALLYAVAVHRFLRWRQSGYRPERHLGGILYLFVRGMAGPDTPVVDGHRTGVFSWRPPAALIVELSELLAGRQDPPSRTTEAGR